MTAITYTANKGAYPLGTEVGFWLADDTAETLSGTNIKADDSSQSGTITAVSSPWYSSLALAQYSISGGVVSANVSTYEACAMNIGSMVAGEWYALTITVTAYTSGTLAFHGCDTANNNYLAITATGTYTIYRECISAFCYLNANAFVGSFTLDSIVRADPDIANGTDAVGLSVIGSVTKSAVATGAELMGYSGFTTSNYLEQLHNSDLDFGTGDFFVCGWAECGTANYQNLFSRSAPSSGVNGPYGGAHFSITKTITDTFQFDIGTTPAAAGQTVSNFDETKWHFLVMVRTSGVANCYIDGALVASFANTSNLTDANSIVRVGRIPDDTWNWAATSANVSLWRVGNVGLSSAQVKQIYDSEKIMFKKNRVFTVVGNTYSLDFGPQDLTRSANAVRTVQRSIGGNQETINFRDEGFWNITTEVQDKDDFDITRRFLDSVTNGQQFSLDPYGTIASPDEPFDVTLESDGYTENRSGPRLLSASFRVREVDAG